MPTRTTSAGCRTCCRRSRACRSTPRRSPAVCWGPRSRSTSSATTRCCRSTRVETVDLGVFSASAIRIGHSIPDAMAICLKTPAGQHHPHRRLQVRPDAGGRQGHRLQRAGRGWAAKASCACCRTPRGPRHPAGRLPSGPWARRSGASWKACRAGSSWPRSRATSRASSRCSTPPVSSDARWPSSGAPWSRTPASPRTWATSTGAPASRSPRTGSRTSPTTRSASPPPDPRASRWPVWRGWPTATTDSWRSCPVTPSS